MFSEKFDRSASKNRTAEIAGTLEGLIIAFILALVFMEFAMQAFRIPTGSMADTLMGDHLRLRCSQCGYKYDYGLLPVGTNSGRRLASNVSRCPSCGYYQSIAPGMATANGDRILVLKCIYQFLEPKQWDVVVFKNPLDPAINYIKRLVGRPGETIEIIDGDIYINGQISTKPSKIQNELWMPVYDNDYQPARPTEGLFNEHIWQQPFKNDTDSQWKLDKTNSTLFTLDSPADQTNQLIYDTSVGNDFRAAYAYNEVENYKHMPYCSDLMVRFHVQPTGSTGHIGIELSKYETSYKAWVDLAGEMVIAKVSQGLETELNRKTIEPSAMERPRLVKFANVDHQLILEFGNEKLIYDLGREPNDAGPRKSDIEPGVKIFGAGKLILSHLAVYRDIHYTGSKFYNSSRTGRAVEGNAFKLKKDEFFVLGDNSPNSEDSRWWSRRGIGNNGRSYNEGIVPRDYLVGKAMFVYWPSGFKPFARFPISIVPNIGRIRLIYGGSDNKL